MRLRTRRLLLGLVLSASAACSEDIDGPSPDVGGLTPSLVCGEQLVTEVVIAGEELSPLAIDTATDQPHLAIPDVSLRRIQDVSGAPVSGELVVLPNDPLDPASARVRWTSSTSMAFDVYPELGLEPGLYEITVANRNGNSATLEAAIAVVAKPELTSVAPDLVCLEQGARSVTLTGTGFLQVGDLLPTVGFDDVQLTVDSLSGCEPLPGPTEAQRCTSAQVTLPEDGLASGALGLVLTNPEPASCRSEEAVTLAVVPPPTLSAVEPDLFCNAQETRTLTLTGSGFVVVRDASGDSFPQVAIGSETIDAIAAAGCTEIDGTLLGAESCTELTVEVPTSVALLGEQTVTVTNTDPAGCDSEDSITVAITPPPVVAAVEPDLFCNAEGERMLTITGSDFVVVDDGVGEIRPTVTIGAETYSAATAEGCTSLAGTLLAAASCDTLTVFVPQDEVGSGAHLVTVTNPDPAGCSSEEATTVALTPEPTLVAAAPDLQCNEDGRTITLTGTDFVRVGDAGGDLLPTVFFGETAVLATAIGGSCAPIEGTLLDASACTELTVEVPVGVVPAGEHALVVENPMPAGCGSNEDVRVVLADPPLIAQIVPEAVCSVDQPASMTVEGSGFLRISDGAGGFEDPVVTVDGAPVAATFSGCVAVTGTVTSGELCSTITFPAPAGGFADGTHLVAVTNPAPADCGASASFEVVSAPVVASVAPIKVCSQGDTFEVTGSGFADGMSIVLDGSISVPTTFVSETTLVGSIESGSVAADLYSVSVTAGGSCESNQLQDALVVEDAPLLFFVDPPIAYNQIDLRLTAFVSGVSGASPELGIRPSGADPNDPITPLGDPSYDGENRVQGTLLAGLAPGDYDVFLSDDPCGATLLDAITVTDVLSVEVTSIDPTFGTEGESTAVTIRSLEPAAGFDQFQATPRVYLNPVAGGTATELRAVSWLDASRLTAVVPETLADGVYQLIVINPDGGVGLLDDAFTVLDETEPPPEITELVPGLVLDSTGQAVTVFGRNFPTVDVDLSVTARCRDPRDAAAPEVLVTAAHTAVASTEVDTTWDMTGLQGYVCVVRVTELVNGSFDEFSALSVTNSSNNINPFVASNDMVVARRAAAGAAVRMNDQSRFLFAIGGDDGAATPTQHSSVEAAPIDPFGEVGTWALQRNSLPEGRSFISAAVVDRFAYVAGGRTGNEVADVASDVLRAYLLDPFEAPEVTDLGLELVDGGLGLNGGDWYYRVAAVMEAGDANNPGGEGLPSEPFRIRLPGGPFDYHVTLFWRSVPGAAQYCIYRTPMADMLVDDARLLSCVPADQAAATQSFVDDASIDNTAETRTPMPLGSLGVWHSVGSMPDGAGGAVAREGAGLVAAPDPINPDLHYLYVVGGKDATGAVRADHNRAVITAVTSSDQSVGALSLGGSVLASARWKIGAVYVDASRAQAFGPEDLWIYVLPGRGGASGEQTVGAVEAFPVDVADGVGADDGSLGAPTTVSNANTGWAGYAYVAGNNFLHMIGAQTGGPSASGQKSQITGVPTTGNWNAGTNLNVARFLHAVARESAFIFLLGGQTDAEAATRSTERTNF